jgi:DNA-binding LacI/PurR family transcriptional regulator
MQKNRVNLKDVAKVAGVSVATVSRVLNNQTSIHDKTRTKVIQAINQLGYEPNRVAQRLRTESTQIFGLILSDVTNPFFTAVVQGIEKVTYDHNYSLLLCNSDEQPEREELYVRLLLAEKVAGVIVSPTNEDSTSYAPLIQNEIPVVAIDRRLRNFAVDTIVTDNFKGAYAAVSLLIQLGHQRIALISGPSSVTTGFERQEGYIAAMREHGLPISSDLIKESDFKQEGGYRAAIELLSLKERPTAFFVANNLMTLGALSAIHQRGLSIPEDVALVGFDDMPWATALNPPLTAVYQPTQIMGRIAAEMLLARIADPKRPVQEIKLEPTLIIRESCGSKAKHFSLKPNSERP